MTDRPTDRARWDRKYGEDPDWAAPRPPDAFVVRALDALDGTGRAVDLAGGNGRHALELARRGWEAHVWDVSPVGLDQAAANAAAAGLALATRAVDLLAERPLAVEEPFDLAVVVNFRGPEVLAELTRLLRPGGHLVYMRHTHDWPGEKPPMEFRVAPGALAAGLPGYATVLHAEEGGRAGLLARREG